MSETGSTKPKSNSLSRRDFLKAAAVTAAVGATAAQIAPRAYAQAPETLRVGLIGCGGRGTGAAMNALNADKGVELVAMGDAFADALAGSLGNLQNSDAKDRVKVDADHQFVGLDAYLGVINSDVDVVLLGEPPHFRPTHLRAAIDAGKHVFAEKPVATDAPGVRSVLESAELAKQKGLSIVSGLCWRYETGMIETVRRIHDGQIGEIVALESTRYHGAVGRMEPRTPAMTPLEWQVRNWYFHAWLSGDFIAEQFVHDLDMLTMAMNDEYPVSCVASGGRQVRTGAEYGDIYDHFNAVFEYADGRKAYAGTRQWPGCPNHYVNWVLGSSGRANLMAYDIQGANPWKLGKPMENMWQLEHNALFAGLRSGELINNGEYMAKSTLMGLMARDSAYTGQVLTWDQMMNSQRDFTLPEYAWDAAVPEPVVPIPGVTQFS